LEKLGRLRLFGRLGCKSYNEVENSDEFIIIWHYTTKFEFYNRLIKEKERKIIKMAQIKRIYC